MRKSKYDKDYPVHYVQLHKIYYAINYLFRIIRLTSLVTKLFGYQYTRTCDLIELDITYVCNLNCNSCNRSCSQAPENISMSLDDIKGFVGDSINEKKMWKRMRVLGGEPTLHPFFGEIIGELLEYKKFNPHCLIEVVTNGYGEKVKSKLNTLNSSIKIDNSNKKGSEQISFVEFNMAPIDDSLFLFSDYRNGCSIIEDCGIGLTPNGYYPCAIAGGIDRVAKLNIGRKKFPRDDDEMRDILKEVCGLCGRFKEDFVPEKLRRKNHSTPMSASWVKIYSKWKSDKK